MNAMRKAWAEGKPSIGSVCPDTALEVEQLGAAGYDWAWFDMQHGVLGFEKLLSSMQALELGGTRAVVRASWNDPAAIMRPLDLGAIGVIVPMVNSASEAEQAAGAMRYPPAGYRSWGPLRNSFASPGEANQDVVCIILIETLGGLEHAEEIAATPGVDVLFLAPSDLALALGREPDDLYGMNDDALEYVSRLVAAAERHGKVAGAVGFSVDHTEALLDRGVRWVSTVISNPREQIAEWKERYVQAPASKSTQLP